MTKQLFVYICLLLAFITQIYATEHYDVNIDLFFTKNPNSLLLDIHETRDLVPYEYNLPLDKLLYTYKQTILKTPEDIEILIEKSREKINGVLDFFREIFPSERFVLDINHQKDRYNFLYLRHYEGLTEEEKINKPPRLYMVKYYITLDIDEVRENNTDPAGVEKRDIKQQDNKQKEDIMKILKDKLNANTKSQPKRSLRDRNNLSQSNVDRHHMASFGTYLTFEKHMDLHAIAGRRRRVDVNSDKICHSIKKWLNNNTYAERALSGMFKGKSKKIADPTLYSFLSHIKNSFSATKAVYSLSWGVDRIDSATRQFDQQFKFSFGDNQIVDIYIIDTGVQPNHYQLRDILTGESRVTRIFNAYPSSPDYCHQHGTHVAGIAAGVDVGINGYARIKDVRVLDCSGGGTSWDVANGLLSILDDCPRGNTPVIINLSLGGYGYSSIMDNAMAQVQSECNAFIVAAAGNDASDACDFYPAASQYAMSVGATNYYDQFASFSNRGSCVDILAPGQDIASAWFNSGEAGNTNGAKITTINTISGTSMASPHVAGILSLFAPLYPDTNIGNYVLASAKLNKITGVSTGTPNKFLFIQADQDVAPEPPPPAKAVPPPSSRTSDSSLLYVSFGLLALIISCAMFFI